MGQVGDWKKRRKILKSSTGMGECLREEEADFFPLKLEERGKERWGWGSVAVCRCDAETLREFPSEKIVSSIFSTGLFCRK